MTDSDDENGYSERRHTPIARLEKAISVLRSETNEELKNLKEENDDLKLWKVAHEVKAESEETKLVEVRKTLYNEEGVCNKVRDFSTTRRNLYWMVVIAGIIIGIISNWSKLPG
jgi:uncharacterized protein YdaT